MNGRDRPFYKFEYRTAFIFFMETLAGIVIGAIAFATTLAIPTLSFAFFPAWLVIACMAAYGTGHFITKVMFYVYRKMSITSGLACAGITAMTFTGTCFGFGLFGFIGIQYVIISVILVVATVLILWVFGTRYGKIGLFTDGIKIGKQCFMYPDIIKQPSYGTGPIEKKIPEEDRGKPIRILTPIEYEYVEKNFGIFHVYLIFVTSDAVYVAQSINKQSNLAQDTRNAWSRCVLGHE